MGVRFVGVGGNDSVVAIALNPETTADVAQLDPELRADDDAAAIDDHDEVLPEPAADSAALSSEVEEDDSE